MSARSERQGRGWWRRNLWGLLALIPLVAGVLAINAGAFYDRNVRRQPTRPVVAAPGQPVQYTDAQLRLISLTEVEPTPNLVGRDRTLPPGLTIWRSVVAVDAPKESLISTSEIYLEDTLGRLYGASPSELHGSDAITFGGLGEDREFDLDNPRPTESAGPYTSTSYFVLPSTARPAGIRLVYAPDLPRYVLLTAS